MVGQEQTSTSPLLQPWPGPYGGVPPWDKVRPEEFLPAFQTAIAEALSDIDAIAAQTEPATFDNTLVPLEQAGRTLDRLESLFGVHAGNLNVGPIPEIERGVALEMAEFEDHVTQNEKLFERIATVYEGERHELAQDQRRLVEDRYKEFVRRGAKLDAAKKSELTQINKRLAELFTSFGQNVLADERNQVTWIEDSERLAGLPASLVSAMARTAEERGQKGKWAVANTRSSMDPFLTYAEDRELRETVWRRYYNRGDNGDEHDNNAIIVEILKLRAVRAKLLGYETHAHWQLESQMAKTPENAMELMMSIWPKAVAQVRQDVADMQQLADAENAGITIEPWDYRYYAEKVRAEKYDLDFNVVKPYLQLEKLSEAMLWVAGELFGLRFNPIQEVPVFHPDVQVWEVLDRSGELVGLFYLDPYAREGKRSGAWMTAYRVQQNISQPVLPIVSNNSNFVKAGPDEVALISWDDANTLFHEFGHAMHGLLSKVRYPSQAGTSVARDYVEFPSQLYERWLSTPEVLNRFAVHVETGEPMPAELLAKIERASRFGEGFDTVEFLASGLMDMRLHLAGDADIDPRQFEREVLGELGMPREIVMRHRLPHFAHIFSSDGYSAAYYSYLWADALTADAAEAFEQSGNLYDPETARRLHDEVLSRGDTMDPAEGFRAFRGRDVDTDALLRKRGFPVG